MVRYQIRQGPLGGRIFVFDQLVNDCVCDENGLAIVFRSAKSASEWIKSMNEDLEALDAITQGVW